MSIGIIPSDMKRYCVKCCAEIDAKRVARGSFYCSNACRDVDRKARRRWKAERNCRLCGRPSPRKRQRADYSEKIISSPCAPGAHISLGESPDARVRL